MATVKIFAPSKRIRRKKLNQQSKPVFSLEAFLFKEQLDFVCDPSKFATAVCSVRAGKTVSCAADLINTALTQPGTIGLYITLARSSAKRIIWPELLKLNKDFQLGGKPNMVELSVTFPNTSKIYCGGASTEQEIEKYRGLSNVALAYIDESQAFRAHIKELVEEILIKRLYDRNGRLRLIGTPGPVLGGFFYEAAHNPNWSHHAWTLHQNPHIERKSGMSVHELIEQDCRQRGVTIDDPSIQREAFGRWVLDTSTLLLSYNPASNHFDAAPEGKYNYILGLDIGFVDSDAVVVLAWSDASPTTYLVEELITPSQTTDQLAKQITDLMGKYQFSKMVCDAGGLGKKIVEDLRQRYGLPLEPADKTAKMANYSLLNNALRNGTFRAKKTSVFAADCNLLEKDRQKSTPDKTIVKGHSDSIDATLYAFKFSPAYTYIPPRAKPAHGSPEHWKELEQQLEEHNFAKAKKEHEEKQGNGSQYGSWSLDSNGLAPWQKW